MKIKHSGISTISETDTDKLPDVDALIIEKSEELRLLCTTAKRQCLILVDANGKEDGSAHSFWNIQLKTGEPKTNAIDFARSANNMLTMINSYVYTFTNGQYIITLKDE